MTRQEITISQEQQKVPPIIFQGQVFTYWDSGLTRNVFVNDDFTKVIKVLINSDMDYNAEEQSIYDNATPEAKSKMAPVSLHNGIIVQDFVLPIDKSPRELSIKQAMFADRCRKQVGWDKDGNLVCYDLSDFHP